MKKVTEKKLISLAMDLAKASIMTKYQIKARKEDITLLEMGSSENNLVIWDLLFEYHGFEYKYNFVKDSLEKVN